MRAFADLSSMSEDSRIKLIGETATNRGRTVAFMVDVEGGSHAKGDRYIEKLKRWYPSLSVIMRVDGPVANVETIKVGIVQ